jgi:hypothetical protein
LDIQRVHTTGTGGRTPRRKLQLNNPLQTYAPQLRGHHGVFGGADFDHSSLEVNL